MAKFSRVHESRPGFNRRFFGALLTCASSERVCPAPCDRLVRASPRTFRLDSAIADPRSRRRASRAGHCPNSTLVQEREALAIEALGALGELATARERAARFLARYPASPHAEVVRRMLD
jgi:hypothetical protein